MKHSRRGFFVLVGAALAPKPKLPKGGYVFGSWQKEFASRFAGPKAPTEFGPLAHAVKSYLEMNDQVIGRLGEFRLGAVADAFVPHLLPESADLKTTGATLARLRRLNGVSPVI